MMFKERQPHHNGNGLTQIMSESWIAKHQPRPRTASRWPGPACSPVSAPILRGSVTGDAASNTWSELFANNGLMGSPALQQPPRIIAQQVVTPSTTASAADAWSSADTFGMYAEDCNYFTTEGDSEPRKRVLTPAYDDVGRIDKFTALIQRLVNDNEPCFRILTGQRGEEIARDGEHGRFYHILQNAPDMQEMAGILPFRLLNPLLAEAVTSLGQQTWTPLYPNTLESDGQLVAKHCNQWVNALRRHVKLAAHRQAIERWNKGPEANYRQIQSELSRLIAANRHAHDGEPFEVVRINLGMKDQPQNPDCTPQLQRAARTLIEECRSRTISGDVVGIVCRLEYSDLAGFYNHCLFICRYDPELMGTELSQELGKYWSEYLTDGKGCYTDCRDSSSSYRQRGIGTLYSHDEQAQQVLLENVLAQMTLVDKHCRLDLSNLEAITEESIKPIDYWFITS